MKIPGGVCPTARAIGACASILKIEDALSPIVFRVGKHGSLVAEYADRVRLATADVVTVEHVFHVQ
jgi:hypothetical protein